MRVDPVVLGLPPVDRLHVQGMAKHEGKADLLAEVGHPVPAEHALHGDDHVIAVGRQRTEQVLGSCPVVSVIDDLPVVIEHADVHPPCVQVDPAVVRVALGVESQGPLLSSVCVKTEHTHFAYVQGGGPTIGVSTACCCRTGALW